MNIEDITTDHDNRRILSRIKRNKEDIQDLYIQNEHEIEIDDDDDEEVIDFGYVPEGVQDMGWLGYFVGKNEHLQNLYIRSFEPTSGADAMEALESFLMGVNNNKSIKRLDFDCIDMFFGGRVFTMLEPFFKNNNNLITLNVDECNLGAEGARLLALAIGGSKHQSLQHVSLADNSISDEGMVDIITSLSLHPYMQNLYLEGNQLNKNGCMALSTLLRYSCTKLQHLDLGSNELDDEGIDTLVPVLSKCTKLQELYIDNSPSITTRGWHHIATLLEAPDSNLKILSINRNNVDDQVLTFMVDALANNNSLESLFFLDGNQVTAKGWDSFLKLVCGRSSANSTFLSNHTLCDIDFSKQDLSQVLTNKSRRILSNLSSILFINEIEDKKQVAMIKTYCRNYRNLDMSPFFEWEFKILPLMIDWLEKAFIACNDYLNVCDPTSSEMARHEARHRSVQLSCIYQFVRDMPLLCVETQLRKELDGIQAELDFGLCPWQWRGEEELLRLRRQEVEERKRNILEQLGRWR